MNMWIDSHFQRTMNQSRPHWVEITLRLVALLQYEESFPPLLKHWLTLAGCQIRRTGIEQDICLSLTSYQIRAFSRFHDNWSIYHILSRADPKPAKSKIERQLVRSYEWNQHTYGCQITENQHPTTLHRKVQAIGEIRCCGGSVDQRRDVSFRQTRFVRLIPLPFKLTNAL